MQMIIDFLVNNYLWFIIIAFILVFALIGYLVDTNEKENKNKSHEELNDSLMEDSINEPIKVSENIESLNMDMGNEIEELDKDVIVMPNQVETPIETSETQEQTTEVLEDFE